ncbi:MAG: hypothetical protein H0W49_08005 [Nitrospirales bacterium]|nr:hypothetical protein [Nitrospirales bacterium]
MTMPTRVLGKTGISLPIPGFGTAQAGKRLNHRQAVHLFEAALNDTRTGFAYEASRHWLALCLKKES